MALGTLRMVNIQIGHTFNSGLIPLSANPRPRPSPSHRPTSRMHKHTRLTPNITIKLLTLPTLLIRLTRIISHGGLSRGRNRRRLSTLPTNIIISTSIMVSGAVRR